VAISNLANSRHRVARDAVGIEVEE